MVGQKWWFHHTYLTYPSGSPTEGLGVLQDLCLQFQLNRFGKDLPHSRQVLQHDLLKDLKAPAMGKGFMRKPTAQTNHGIEIVICPTF